MTTPERPQNIPDNHTEQTSLSRKKRFGDRFGSMVVSRQAGRRLSKSREAERLTSPAVEAIKESLNLHANARKVFGGLIEKFNYQTGAAAVDNRYNLRKINNLVFSTAIDRPLRTNEPHGHFPARTYDYDTIAANAVGRSIIDAQVANRKYSRDLAKPNSYVLYDVSQIQANASAGIINSDSLAEAVANGYAKLASAPTAIWKLGFVTYDDVRGKPVVNNQMASVLDVDVGVDKLKTDYYQIPLDPDNNLHRLLASDAGLTAAMALPRAVLRMAVSDRAIGLQLIPLTTATTY